MEKLNYRKTCSLFIFFIGMALLLYAIFKAGLSSFTHDESFSYLHYIRSSFMDILSFKNWYTNNHILNSLFMKYAEKLFGSSEIALRMPNLLLFGVYMSYCYLLFRKFHPFLMLGIFVLLVTNSSIIDFFALARGYGLSFGFMVMALYHFFRYFDAKQKHHIYLFHAASLLAVLSSFPLLHFYVMLLLIYNVLVIIDSKVLSNGKFAFFSSNRVHFIPLLINGSVFFEPVRKALLHSRLDFGGKNGFYADTVGSIIQCSFHGYTFSPAAMLVTKLLFTAVVLIPFVVMMGRLIRKEGHFFTAHRELLVLNLLLIFMSAAIILQHLILKADYPISRFSLFISILFILHLGFVLAWIFDYYRRSVLVIILGLALLSGISFVDKADLYTSSEWGYDRDTKNMIRTLTGFHHSSQTTNDTVKLGVHWLFEPSCNFYRETYNLTWLLPVDRNGIGGREDYYYSFKSDFATWDTSSYILISEFPGSATALIKRRDKPQ